MPLFHIQDNDRPAYVKADSYGEAVDKWLGAVANENDGERGDLPKGVSLVVDDDELIIEHDFEG